MSDAFAKPKGAHGDVAELEYLSALHQSSPDGIRTDGSIGAIDIKNYLISRHGINIKVEDVRKTIMKSFAGGDEEEECLDLSELVAILIIPYLVKTAKLFSPPQPETSKEPCDFENEYAYQSYMETKKIMDKLKPENTDIIKDMLSIILYEATGCADPAKLDAKLLKDIFDSFGESELAEDDKLIEDMIVAASTKSMDGEDVMLNEDTFIHALTADVMKYDELNETKLTTYFQDVFGVENQSYELIKSSEMKCLVDNDEERGGFGDDTSYKPCFDVVFTASSIDTQSDTYMSSSISILLWINFIITFFAYFFSAQSKLFMKDCSTMKRPFPCYLSNYLVIWIVTFVKLSVFGTFYICYGSLGNGTGRGKAGIFATLGSYLTIIMVNILPYFYPIDKDMIFLHRYDTGYVGQFIVFSSMMLGFIIIFIYTHHLLVPLIPKRIIRSNAILEFLFLRNAIRHDTSMKQSSAFKVNRMINNAFKLHHIKHGYKTSLLKFVQDRETETIGGIIWCYKKAFDHTLFTEEGVWISSRLKGCMFCNFIIVILILLYGIDNLDLLYDPTDSSYDVQVKLGSIISGVGIGCLFTILMSIVFFPSVVGTTLKFRFGAIPTFRDQKYFGELRMVTDSVTSILPSIFWGLLYSTIFISIIFGSIIFLSLWSVTMTLMSKIWAGVLSFAITLGIMTIFLTTCRRTVHAGFFRASPYASNLLHVFLGSWNVGTAVGFMTARAFKLIFITTLYVGRLDTPILAPGVESIGPIKLESMPDSFKKDILVHEAHRHPYMETLGLMYMMKLRYGDKFASTPGSLWRLIFVFALMPWLRKYRLMTRPELRKNGEDDEERTVFDSSGLSDEMIMLVQQQPSRKLLFNQRRASGVSVSKERRESGVSVEQRRQSTRSSIHSDVVDYQNLLTELDKDVLECSDDDGNLVNQDAKDEIQRIKVEIRALIEKMNVLERTIERGKVLNDSKKSMA